MINRWEEIMYILAGYLSGSVLYSYLLPKYLKKIDVTEKSEDGNPEQPMHFYMQGFPWESW